MATGAHVELDRQEEEEVEERRLPPPHVVFETIRQEGEQDLERSATALFFSEKVTALALN